MFIRNDLVLTLVVTLSSFITGTLAGNYNYGDVLGKSILFYEAQRTGKLPSTNRIPWRGDSFLTDAVSGGYFDAGDYVKFGFPMAFSMTYLAWGLLDHKAGYEAAGQLKNGLDMLRWGTDYLIKAHPSANELYCQIGDGDADHSSWDRPENWPASPARPSLKLTTSKPGSEVAGDSASALAAASMVFKNNGDTNYATTLLNHAKQLFTFGNTYRGVYSDTFPEAAKFYKSFSGYGDELGFAAAWLWRATGDTSYKTEFDKLWNEFNLGQTAYGAGWDGKYAQLQILMSKIDGGQKYKAAAQSFCDWVVYTLKKTPKGLAFFDQWGSLRHSANAAFACLELGQTGVNTAAYNSFAKQQIDYMLGDTGRSFVVGFGNNPPVRPHHRASSCPSPPATCGWYDLDKSDPNPHVLVGALVGGPDENDYYEDNRRDAVKNEVALDYNAGFTSALAALIDLQKKKQI